jgi:O-antigen/teichoic acid export membrane protein
MLSKIKEFLFKNKTEKQTVAKNAVWLSISNFGGRAIKAIVVIYGARVLGTAGYGLFSYAITLAGFLTLFMDPGINGILMRDASRADDTGQKEIFSTTFVIKIILLTIGVGIVMFVAPLFSILPGAKALLPIVAVILGLDTMREFFSSLLRAKEKMEWEAAIYLLTNLGILIFGFMFLAVETSAASFSWAYVVGDIIGIILAATLIRNYFKNIFTHFSPKRVGPILGAAWPFAITGALGALLTNTDILIISWMRSASDVGIYSAAIRIVQLLYLVPMIFQFSTLPALARFANSDKDRFRNTLEQTLKIIFLVSVPLALGGIIIGTDVMQLIFGAAYMPGGLAFKILLGGLLFDFPAAVISSAVFAYNKQKALIITSAIGGVVNVILDLILIPHFGITGSAIATLAAQIASNTYLWHTMDTINRFSVVPKLLKIAIAGIFMAFCTFAFRSLGINLFVNIAVSGLIYIAALAAQKEPFLKQFKF